MSRKSNESSHIQSIPIEMKLKWLGCKNLKLSNFQQVEVMYCTELLC